MAEKPEIGITNWFKEILGVEFTFHHFIRENVPLAFGGYFLLEQREMSSWPLFSFQDTLLQMFNDPFPMSLPSHILFSLAGACWLLNYTTVNTTVLFKQASLTKKSFNFYETSLSLFWTWMNVLLVPIPVASIPCARIPWVHTHARVMLGTQEMENLAMVFDRHSNIHVRLPLFHNWRWSYKYRNFEISFNKLF